MKVGTQLMIIRKDKKINQIDLAKMAGVSVPTISKIEGNGNTSISTLEAICKVLKKEVVINIVDIKDDY